MPEITIGKRALLEMLKAEGMEYIWGNLGMMELNHADLPCSVFVPQTQYGYPHCTAICSNAGSSVRLSSGTSATDTSFPSISGEITKAVKLTA